MKSVPRQKWIAFLKKQGLVYIRTKGDHEIWDNPRAPLKRCIIVVSGNKDVPLLHLHTSLKTLGISKADFLEAIKDC